MILFLKKQCKLAFHTVYFLSIREGHCQRININLPHGSGRCVDLMDIPVCFGNNKHHLLQY